jgi:hypothetical protein
MSEAELLLRDASSYLKAEDVRQIQSAYEFSEAAHEGQFRQTGEPYISHPIEVAKILTQWHLDSQALTAALLHDVMEDTAVTKSEISDKFGRMVAELVDGVSKLDKIEFESQEQAQAENFRKMFLAMARDVRVILIKLADRLHNMRTLDVMQPKKRMRIARETIEIYAPIANRLGLNQLYQELEELSFQHLYPNRYRVLKRALEAQRGNRHEVVEKILDAIKQRLNDAKLDAAVTGREKNLFSIYKKMQDKNLSFSKVLDIYAFRVIVKDAPPAISRWARSTACTSRFRASSRTTSRSPRPTAISRCTPRCSVPSAARSRFRSAPRRCIALPKPVSPRTGCTRAPTRSSRSCSARPINGCRACSTCSPRAATRSSFSSTSRSICSRRGVCVHAQGQIMALAARSDLRGLRLQRAHRHRQPLRGRQDQLRAGAAAQRAQERRSCGNHHGARTPSPIRHGSTTS